MGLGLYPSRNPIESHDERAVFRRSGGYLAAENALIQSSNWCRGFDVRHIVEIRSRFSMSYFNSAPGFHEGPRSKAEHGRLYRRFVRRPQTLSCRLRYRRAARLQGNRRRRFEFELLSADGQRLLYPYLVRN